MQPAPSNGTVQHPPAFTLQDAAGRLGVSLNTLRRRIAAGEIRAERVERPQGYTWAVYLDPEQHPPVNGAQHPPGTLRQDAGSVQPADTALVEALAMIERQQQTIMEVSGRCGFLQAQVQQLRAALEAPKVEQMTQEPSAAIEPASEPQARPWWRRAWRWVQV